MSGPQSPNSPILFTPSSTSFDAEAFDRAIADHGTCMVHYKALPNPVGLQNEFDSRRPAGNDVASTGAHIFRKAGCVSALLIGNSKEVRAVEGGTLSGSTVQLTPARFYDDTAKQVYLQPYDRIYYKDCSVLVSQQELATANGARERLKFPAVEVLDLIDARGREYVPAVDFNVVDGDIVWVNAPEHNAALDVGTVFSIRYLYKPYFIIERLIHALRVAQVEDPRTGERQLTQMPQTAIAVREHVFRSEQRNPEVPDTDQRQAPAPQYGGFGVR